MTWMPFLDDARRRWLIQQDGLWLLCQQYAYAQLLSERARVVHDRSGFFSLGPSLGSVEIDTTDFHAAKERRAAKFCDNLARASLVNAASAFDQLVQMKDELDLLTADFRAMNRRVSRENARSIESHVDFFGGAATVARYIRDGAATILLVTSALATGGASAGVLGAGMTAGTGLGVTAAGSALKGLATYEDSVLSKGGSWSDSGSIGAGLLQATSTFTVSALPIVGKLGTVPVRDSVMLLVTAPINAFSTFAVGVAKGDGMGKSLAAAAVGAGASFIPAGDKLEKLAVPVMARFSLPVQKVLSAGLQSAASMAMDKGQDWVVDKLGSRNTPKVAPQVKKLVGVPTQLDRPVSSRDYIRNTVLAPA